MRRFALRGLIAALAFALVAITPSGAVAAKNAPVKVVCRSGAVSCPIHLAFAPGAVSAEARGVLVGHADTRWFSVRARAGQTMIVVVEGAGPTRGVVRFPGGGAEGQPGGRIFDGALSVSGEYRIEVGESLMGQTWSGRVEMAVIVY